MNRILAAFGHGFPIIFLALLTGCTSTRFKTSDFSGTNWSHQEGQALWKATREAPEIAGEILYFKGLEGNAAIQFTKSPFPVLLAQIHPSGWQIEFLTEKKTYSGAGNLPRKYGPLPLGWLVLSSILAGNTVPPDWEYKREADGSFRLSNNKTGETLTGFL